MGRRRHHYIPQSYLKWWAAPPANRLYRYIKVRGEVVFADYTPKGVGFAWDLYKIPGVSPELQHQIEDLYLQQVDDKGAKVLARMVNGPIDQRIVMRDKIAAARLLLSIIVRSPQEVDKLKSVIAVGWQKFLPGRNEFYRRFWKPGMPETLEEYANSDPHLADRIALHVLRTLVENRALLRFISRMHWRIIDVSGAGRTLMTSDRPLVRTNGLAIDYGHFAMPISPTRVWAAAPIADTLAEICNLSPRVLVRELNRKVIGQAVREVYAVDPYQSQRVKKYLSKTPPMSVIKDHWHVNLVE